MEASLNGPLGRTALGQGALKIGRAPDNTLVINDPQSSAHHAEVTPGFDGNSYQVVDLNSTNGTYVNEQRLTANAARPLNPGDVIRIGSLRFTYESGSGYEPTMLAGASFNNDQTVASQTPAAPAQPPAYPQQPAYQPQPAYPQQPAYPAQQSMTPPPAFTPTPTQPRAEYPQAAAPAQPGYPPAGGYSQPGYPPMGGYSQQGGYPPAGNFPQQSYPPQKKSRAGLWIGIIVVLILLIGGGIGGYFYINRSTPEKTLQAYCTALQNNDAQGIYNTYSSDSQSKTDVQKISQGLKFITLITGPLTCSYSNVQQSGSTATATLTLTPTRGKAGTGTVHLVDENNQWKIENNTPGLPNS